MEGKREGEAELKTVESEDGMKRGKEEKTKSEGKKS